MLWTSLIVSVAPKETVLRALPYDAAKLKWTWTKRETQETSLFWYDKTPKISPERIYCDAGKQSDSIHEPR